MTSPAVEKSLQDALRLHRQGDLHAAMDRYMGVLRDDPRNADALFYVAVVVLQDGQYDQGIKLAQRALSLEPPPGPPQARLHNLIGQANVRLGKHDDALASFDRAIALQPDFADAHGNRANLLADLGRLDEAMVGFDNALLLRADSFEDWCNRGTALQWLDRTEEALRSYERAIALKPDLAGAHFNRGNILRDLSQIKDAGGTDGAPRFDAAVAAYSEAIRLTPDFADAHLGRALVHLLRGEWDAGFRDYEHRSHVGEPTYKPLPQPRWTGEPLPGARLVLVTEQGLGDIIHFCRFAPLLAARGFDVTILAREAMQPLLSTLPDVTIVTAVEQLKGDKPFRWLPLLDIAGVLGVTPDTVPAAVPYLAAEPERIAAWGQRLGGGGGFKIGINWVSGHSSNRHFIKRNIPLSAFAPLAALPGARLISLQHGPDAAQIADVTFRGWIEGHDLDAGPARFLDTAAVMTHLDLIVTCDTSIPHLAGALGRPVFTALPAIADWRWMLTRDDSPWYPTMRLFRQRTRGDWTEVMARIAQAAAAMIPGRP